MNPVAPRIQRDSPGPSALQGCDSGTHTLWQAELPRVWLVCVAGMERNRYFFILAFPRALYRLGASLSSHHSGVGSPGLLKAFSHMCFSKHFLAFCPERKPLHTNAYLVCVHLVPSFRAGVKFHCLFPATLALGLHLRVEGW